MSRGWGETSVVDAFVAHRCRAAVAEADVLDASVTISKNLLPVPSC